MPLGTGTTLIAKPPLLLAPALSEREEVVMTDSQQDSRGCTQHRGQLHFDEAKVDNSYDMATFLLCNEM